MLLKREGNYGTDGLMVNLEKTIERKREGIRRKDIMIIVITVISTRM